MSKAERKAAARQLRKLAKLQRQVDEMRSTTADGHARPTGAPAMAAAAEAAATQAAATQVARTQAARTQVEMGMVAEGAGTPEAEAKAGEGWLSRCSPADDVATHEGIGAPSETAPHERVCEEGAGWRCYRAGCVGCAAALCDVDHHHEGARTRVAAAVEASRDLVPVWPLPPNQREVPPIPRVLRPAAAHEHGPLSTGCLVPAATLY